MFIPKLIKVLFFCFIFAFYGCYSLSSFKTTPARLGPKTETNKELRSLPDAKEKIVCAVYKFRDQTGQYKEVSSGASWSTAVTQGATSILIKALEESNWFIPIEREGLSNLLNERKIIRSSRANFEGESEDNLPPLPPLLYAGVILEGGIISYETNIVTGGTGLKYFGAGASDQYRQDQVSIYLRATSTSNGRVLKTVYTTKTILSQLVDVSLYRFVEIKRLLEFETGFSYNEPPQLAVTAAIEKAVQSLIVEGLLDGLWALKDPGDINNPSVIKYQEEKKLLDNTDFLGNETSTGRNDIAVGILAGVQKYTGEYPKPLTENSADLIFKVQIEDGFYFTPNVGVFRISMSDRFKQTFANANLDITYHIFPQNRLSPYLMFGLGGFYGIDAEPSAKKEIGEKLFFSSNLGLGLEYMFTDNIGLNIFFTYKYFLSDDVDDQIRGKYNDYYLGGKAGILFYLF
jgi:curli production assembly/transport component CsgG